MALNKEELDKPTTGSQTVDRKRSLSPETNDITSATKKRSTDNQATDNITTTLPDDSNTTNDIPNDVTELFEEIDEKSTAQGTVDSGQDIDTEFFETPTYTPPPITETEVIVPNTLNEETDGSASATKATESTSIPTAEEASNKENRLNDPLPAPTTAPMEKDTATTSTSGSPTTLAKPPTNKKHHPGLNVPDKSCTVRQPSSDKFFFSNEAYESYSHDSFMANIDSITKKNKPGLALSLERPTSSSVPRPPPSAHHHHHQPQRRISNSHGTANAMAMKSSSTDSTTKNPPSTTKNNNILDSLLDSISKNDRPVPAKPVHVPSDIEIAMQAADLPQE